MTLLLEFETQVNVLNKRQPCLFFGLHCVCKEVNFGKTLFSMSAPGADYFELAVIFEHVCADLGYLLSLQL